MTQPRGPRTLGARASAFLAPYGYIRDLTPYGGTCSISAMETTTRSATMFPTNEDTRAGRMMAAGRVEVTFRSPSGTHITLLAKCRKRGDNGRWVRSTLADAMVVFIEVPNQHGWNDRVGKCTRRGGFVQDPGADTARVWCAEQLLRVVNGEDTAPGLEVMVADRCGCCGRALTDPVSIERGIGPECYGRATGSRHQTRQRTQLAGTTRHEIETMMDSDDRAAESVPQ